MQTELALDRDELVRRWKALEKDPDSPDRHELTEFGELVLSPKPTNDHRRAALAVVRALEAQLGPEAGMEISVLTDRGIRVPDVCVEVLSPGNFRAEIMMKVGAYLRGGAREVIVVGLEGEVECFGAEGKRKASVLGIRLALPAELF